MSNIIILDKETSNTIISGQEISQDQQIMISGQDQQ